MSANVYRKWLFMCYCNLGVVSSIAGSGRDAVFHQERTINIKKIMHEPNNTIKTSVKGRDDD